MNLKPFNDAPTRRRYNLDGYMTYNSFVGEEAFSYLQIYRNGITESTDSYILSEDIHSEYFEEQIIKSISSYLNIQKNLNV